MQNVNTVHKHLDIDSAHRNRRIFPNQADFVIPFMQSLSGIIVNATNALDPVSDAAPYESALTSGNALTLTTIVLSSTSSTITNFYINSIVAVPAVDDILRTITSYNGTTLTANVTPAFPGLILINTAYTIRRVVPIFGPSATSLFGAASTMTSVHLAVTTPTSIVGMFVRISKSANPALVNQIATIFSYNTGTNFASVSPFTAAPVAGDQYEILPFSRENSSGLLYAGTLSIAQSHCYEIKLLHLVVPKQLLNVQGGGLAENFPYLYVTLTNENENSSGALYTNNPNAIRAVFKVPINLYSGITSFYTLKDSKATQTVKFKPFDTIRITVTMPNGEILRFVQADNISPVEPNPMLQINYLFSLRRC